MKPLRIAIFSPNFSAAMPAPEAVGAWRLLRALVRHDHRVTVYQPDLLGRHPRRASVDPDGVRIVNYPTEGYLDLFECLEEASLAQVIFKFSGAGPFDQLLDGAVLEVRRPGALAAFVATEPQALIARVRRDPADSFLALIPEFDLFMLAGGGIPSANMLKHLGARECALLWSALVPETRQLVPPDPRIPMRPTAPVTSAHLRALEVALAHGFARCAAPVRVAPVPAPVPVLVAP